MLLFSEKDKSVWVTQCLGSWNGVIDSSVKESAFSFVIGLLKVPYTQIISKTHLEVSQRSPLTANLYMVQGQDFMHNSLYSSRCIHHRAYRQSTILR